MICRAGPQAGHTGMVHRPTLSEVIEGALISSAADIAPTEDEPVRAIDVLGGVAALFRFSIDGTGAWFEECSIALRAADGTWKQSTGGGSHGDGWKGPRRPSTRTLDGHTISIFGSVGLDRPDEKGDMVFVRAIYGFSDPVVRALRVNAASGERTVKVASPAGAFVVLVAGDGAVEFQGLDAAGLGVGQPATAAPASDSETRRSFLRWRRDRQGLDPE